MTESTLTFIDAHHHLWDLKQCNYPWLMATGERRFFGDPTPIQKNYLPVDFLNESKRYRPNQSVHIQVGVAEQDEVRETQWLQSLGGCPQGIVAAADLRGPNLTDQLDAHARFDRLRGIRQIIGRHSVEDAKNGSDALLDDPAFLLGLKELASRELSFDLQMTPPQMPWVIALLREVPNLRVALCHAGSPWDQSPAGFSSWRRGLQLLAELPNVSCKVSGLGMFNPRWNAEDLRPLVLTVIETFTPKRTMFGSNFPVDKLYATYDELWECYDHLTANFSKSERQQMFYTTSARFYRL